MVADYYYFQHLNAEDKELYKAMLNAVLKHEEEIELPKHKYDDYHIQLAFDSLKWDNPHLYYLDSMYLGRTLFDTVLVAKYYFDEITCKKYNEKIQAYVNAIIKQAALSKNMSEYEKVIRVYNQVASKVKYDHDDLPERRPHDRQFNHTILGVFLEKKAVCEGIAYAFKLLLNAINIKCIYVPGMIEGNDCQGKIPHAWNIVKMDGVSAHIDVTNVLMDVDRFGITYDYFGLTDSQIQKSHSDYYHTPRCDKNDRDYMISAGRAVRSFDELIDKLKKIDFSKNIQVAYRFDYKCDFHNEMSRAQDYLVSILQGRQIFAKVGTSVREKQNIAYFKVDLM